MTQKNGRLQLISGSSHIQLAEKIAQELGTDLCKVDLGKFANGEIGVKILDSVRGNDVFVLQSHASDINSSIIEQALIIDAAKRADARSITAVCPFMAYARQDRKSNVREPIAARVVVDILTNAGADRMMSVDLHSGQIQGFASGPFDHVIARPVLIDYLKTNFNKDDLVIVSPDAGRVKSAERYSNEIGCGMAIVHKYRSYSERNASEAKNLIGDVQDKVCIIIDDMIDTAGTICSAAELIALEGAREVYGLTTHAILSDPASERIARSPFKKIIATDTLPVTADMPKLQTVSIAPLLASAIKAAQSGQSVSALFAGENQY